MRYMFSFVSLLCFFLSACNKDKVDAVPAEVPVEKSVTYTVYAERDYSDPYYLNTKGQLELTIAKITENGTKTEVLWDTVFVWRKLADFPVFQNRAILQKNFYILDSKEKLQVSVVRKYDFNGALSQSAKGEPAANGTIAINYDVPM
ncbi:MAG: hypothetical protein ACXWCZ_04345 [Flavisolibacter sp.]